MAMDLSLIDWGGILTKLGLGAPGIIMGMMWWFERQDRIRLEKQHRLDIEMYHLKVEAIAKESIQAITNSTFTASTLISLLVNLKKGRG